MGAALLTCRGRRLEFIVRFDVVLGITACVRHHDSENKYETEVYSNSNDYLHSVLNATPVRILHKDRRGIRKARRRILRRRAFLCLII